MNIRLLRVFQTVCRTENITKAAELLHMTQPAVSQAIQDLELNTELILFDRLGRRIHLTEMGRAYLDKVKPLLEMCDALEESAKEIQKTVPLRIGSCLTIAKHSLPDIHCRFKELYNAPVLTTIAGASQILNLLKDNQIDLALYEGPTPAGPYRSKIFSSYKLIPVCSKNHPFADKTVSIEEFLAESLLLREVGSAVRDVLDSFLRLKGKIAHPILTSTDSQALIKQVKANLGISILPDKILPSSLDAIGLASFTVEDMHLQNDNRVLYHKDKSITQAMEIYLSIVLTVH